MPEAVIQVAPDSTGKMLRTISETQGANTVHQQVVIPQSARTRTGYYRADSGLLTIIQTPAAAPAALLWLINPVGSAVAVSVKSVLFLSSGAAVAAAVTRVLAERITFTGTATGAAVTPAKRVNAAAGGLTADAANVGSVRTANTGLTITTGAAARSFMLPAILGAAVVDSREIWNPDSEDDELILAAGEGLAFRQADAGVATDPRRVVIGVRWEEFTAP